MKGITGKGERAMNSDSAIYDTTMCGSSIGVNKIGEDERALSIQNVN